ncbi:metallophosphoesterase [Rhodococcus oxybenzonivorans]|uniref:metallophosphoesterase n=1 Tax=Rhodococcus oxybenzonivorans TaxID=1990687 RepID=UPI002955D912|nr:metallophosphoesterase [Rhodococcus oxybenzonivorans]MDV7355430.1 metallophosphoesterase [Rhodococcus oxybenzonivorans]
MGVPGRLATLMAVSLVAGVLSSDGVAGAEPEPRGAQGLASRGLLSSTPLHSAVMFAGITDDLTPSGRVPGDESDRTSATTHRFDEYPYMRYEVTFVPGTLANEVVWEGRSVNLDDVALHVWDEQADSWGEPVATTRPDIPGGPVRLSTRIEGADSAQILVIDSPRRDRSFRDANSEADQQFADPASYDFAIQHITDTQYVSRDNPAVFDSMTRWTADNAADRKIAYSMHTGDLVQSWIRPGAPDTRARPEFEVADKAMSTLEDAGIPHGVLPGNHDNLWNVGGRLIAGEHEKNHALYNEFFGPWRYQDRPYWGGSVTETDNSAHYDLLDLAGAKFLMLYIGYNPPERVLQWAEDVLAAHPDRNVMIGSHYYLDEDGSLRMSGFGDIGGSAGQQIWNRLVVPFDTVFLVLAGHVDGQTTVTDRKVGDTDRTVVELLADYQNFRVDNRRETGFQRLLQFDLDGGTLAVTTHSPALNSFRVEDFDPQRRYEPGDGDFVTDVELRADMPRAVIPAT